MRPHTRILYSLCDRITGEAREARQKDTESNQARALHPTAQACAVGTPALPGYQGQSPAEPLPGLLLDERLQSTDGRVPLIGDAIEASTRHLETCRLELPDPLASAPV